MKLRKPACHRSYQLRNLLLGLSFLALTPELLAQPSQGEAKVPSASPLDTKKNASAEPDGDKSLTKDKKETNADSSEMSDGNSTEAREEGDTGADLLKREQARRTQWLLKNASTALPERADVLALTVAGGVSLGSYEAGMLHLLTEALRRSPGSAELKVVTGASAGSANAMIAGTDACQQTIKSPEASLGYRVWVHTGLDQLFDPKQVTSRSLFGRDGMDAGFTKMAATWQLGLPDDCDFIFGVAVTREEGYDVHLAPGLVVPRQAERFVVRVQGRGRESAPIFSNYLDPAQNFERPLLPLTGGRDKMATADIAAIRQLVSASAAFPVAFEPQAIEHCTTARRTETSDGPLAAPPQCDVATRVDAFVDGGVFDNNPLGTAYQVATDGLVENGGEPNFRPVPTGGKGAVPEVVFGYVDPDLRNYTIYEPPTEQDDEKRDPMVNILTRLGGQVLSSARGQELASLAERDPRALERLWIMESSYPPVSELLVAFFGFFEYDFRDFDFHLGSYDTLRDLRDNSGTMLGVEPFLKRLEKFMVGPLTKIPQRYRKLGCILAHTEPDRHRRLAPLCRGDSMKNFRALLQMTIDRLWSNCLRLTEADTESRPHLQCKRARGGLPAPVVDRSFKVKKQRFRTASESEFDYSIRLLADYQFHFRDLGLSRSNSKGGRLAIRRKLVEMVNSLADAQPGFSDRTMVLTAGRLMVNGIQYEPPPRRWYVMLGSSVAAGYLQHLPGSHSLFWNVDARIHSLRTLISDRPNEFASTVGLGLEWALLPLSGSIFQTAIGARGAYQFAVVDSIGTQGCDENEAQADSRFCSQPVIQLPFNLTVLERIRFNITPLFFPMRQNWGHNVFDVEMGFGGEFF